MTDYNWPEYFADGEVDILRTSGGMKFQFNTTVADPDTKEQKKRVVCAVIMAGDAFQSVLSQSLQIVNDIQKQMQDMAKAQAATAAAAAAPVEAPVAPEQVAADA